MLQPGGQTMTSSIRSTMRSALAAATLFAGAVACSGKSKAPTLASDLQGDLAAAQTSSIELANEGPRRTQVVSAEELTGGPAARPPHSAPQSAPRAAPRAVPHKATRSQAPAPAPAAPSVVV